MIWATYTSDTYKPEDVVKRYVRFSKWSHEGSNYDEWRWCEVNAKRFDIRQGTCDESDLPLDVAKEAKDKAGYIPSYVEWPV